MLYYYPKKATTARRWNEKHRPEALGPAWERQYFRRRLGDKFVVRPFSPR